MNWGNFGILRLLAELHFAKVIFRGQFTVIHCCKLRSVIVISDSAAFYESD